jgi:hypothetical protein
LGGSMLAQAESTRANRSNRAKRMDGLREVSS